MVALQSIFRREIYKTILYPCPHSAMIKHHFQSHAEIIDVIKCKQDSKL